MPRQATQARTPAKPAGAESGPTLIDLPKRKPDHYGEPGHMGPIEDHLLEIIENPNAAHYITEHLGDEDATRQERQSARQQLEMAGARHSWAYMRYQDIAALREDLAATVGNGASGEALLRERAQMVVNRHFPLEERPARGRVKKVVDAAKNPITNTRNASRRKAIERIRANEMALLTMDDSEFDSLGEIWKVYEQVRFADQEAKINPRDAERTYKTRMAELDIKHSGLLSRANEIPLPNDELIGVMAEIDEQWQDYLKSDEYKLDLKALKAAYEGGRSELAKLVVMTDEMAQRQILNENIDELIENENIRDKLETHLASQGLNLTPEQSKARVDRWMATLRLLLQNPAAHKDFAEYSKAAERRATYEKRRKMGRSVLMLAASRVLAGHPEDDDISGMKVRDLAGRAARSTWQSLRNSLTEAYKTPSDRQEADRATVEADDFSVDNPLKQARELIGLFSDNWQEARERGQGKSRTVKLGLMAIALLSSLYEGQKEVQKREVQARYRTDKTRTSATKVAAKVAVPAGQALKSGVTKVISRKSGNPAA